MREKRASGLLLLIAIGFIAYYMSKREKKKEGVGGVGEIEPSTGLDVDIAPRIDMWNYRPSMEKAREIAVKYESLIYFNAGVHFIPAHIIGAIIAVESGGNKNLTGKAKERGLMQLKEAAWTQAERFGAPVSPFSRAYEAKENIEHGVAYLAWTRDEMKKVISRSDLVLDESIHAYNKGVGGYKSGSRNHEYYNRVQEYSELFYEIWGGKKW